MNQYFSKRIVLDYVFGNDIEGYNIDDLEDNYLFMIEVIKYTKDKKIYDLCSENVKLNHEFVKFLITTFQKDMPFIKKIVNYYFENRKIKLNDYGVDIEGVELTILMNNLVTDNDKDFLNYRLKTFGLYQERKLRINLFLEEEKENKKLINELGLGFFLVMDTYENSDIILEFFAKQYLFDLFENREDFNLKRYFHERFSKFEDIEEMGITNFFINYIARHDGFLASYISTHIHLLDELKKETSNIKKNWKYYENQLMEKKVDILFTNTKKYLSDNGLEDTYYYLEILYYILKQLNLIEQLKEYDDYLEILDEDYNEDKEYYETKFNPDIPKLSLKKTLKELEHMIVTTLKSKTIVEEDNYIDIKEKQNTIKKKVQILKFKSIRTN